MTQRPSSNLSRHRPAIALALIAGLALATEFVARRSRVSASPAEATLDTQAATSRPDPTQFGTTILGLRSAPRVKVGVDNITGQDVTVSCQTCHANQEPNLEQGISTLPEQFHQDLKFRHGELGCLSCHDWTNYDRLHLANGAAVEYSNVMTLCAQCHSKRHEDYEHGAHGGMNGHWDLEHGPRTRKHCVDCHDPHWPQFPKMMPTFKPLDRFLEAEEPHGPTDHE
ncbi:MAG TPA: hypothetical protein EYF98_07145 [Planctomycetes bacterium]|jgi:hypothetical protein|nr:hypothetical protein [Planctomycetota bacterium]